jgi:hypothetical protein
MFSIEPTQRIHSMEITIWKKVKRTSFYRRSLLLIFEIVWDIPSGNDEL